MIREKNIKWYMQNPSRLMQMKPFTRGGFMQAKSFPNTVVNGGTVQTDIANIEYIPVSQDLYITEYRPDLHHIILNKTIPHIKLVIDGVEYPSGMIELTQTASFQKLIHSAHVRNLTANRLEFDLFDPNPDDSVRQQFESIKQEWVWRGCEWNKYQAINTCKQLGNCGVLFRFDKSTMKYEIVNFSYEDGYQIIPNYDEYGTEIARSLVYEVDGKTVIETYDAKNHYRCVQGDKNNWEITTLKHGFSRCPLLHKRGKVAWEYAESSIEMWELMTNINAVALKRFGTFALALWGDMDDKSFERDSSTLIINLSSDTTNGKQDAQVLKFPEPQTMDAFLKTLEEKISMFSSTSFITPKDITSTNSGGNGIALAMSNDFALATQGAEDWSRFMNDMVYLHQEGLDLELNKTENAKLRIGARIVPWSLETNNTKITNLQMEAKYLSTQTILEKMPDAAPDEPERVIKERGALVSSEDYAASKDAEKAQRISENRSNEIRDNVAKQNGEEE